MSITKLFSWYLIKTTKGDIMSKNIVNKEVSDWMNAHPTGTYKELMAFLKANNISLSAIKHVRLK